MTVASKLTSTIGHCRVVVEFINGLSPSQIVSEIRQLSNSQIILWYIGCNGLRKTGVHFYRDQLISPILDNNSKARFWLVDLTAWNAFKNQHGSIRISNSCCEIIEQFMDKRIRIVKSSSIFKKMQEIIEPELISYFRQALRRDFIRKPSQDFPDSNIQVQDIFTQCCPVMSDWMELDTAKAYSLFQYFEGCLLVDGIFMQMAKQPSSSNLELVFVLPNDELKYYWDEGGSFQKDIEFLISHRCECLGIEAFDLRIKFFSFAYGTRLDHRPYNAPSSVMKKDYLSYEDVIGKNGYKQ